MSDSSVVVSANEVVVHDVAVDHHVADNDHAEQAR